MRPFFLDVACALASPWIAFSLCDPSIFTSDHIDRITAYAVTGFVATLSVVAFSSVGRVLPKYFSRRDVVAVVKVASASTIITVIVVFGITRVDNVPRSLPAIHLLVLIALMVSWRSFGQTAHVWEIRDSSARNRPVEHVIVIGANGWTWLYSNLIETLMPEQRRIMAILDEDSWKLGRSVYGYQVIGDIRDIDRVVEEYGVHGVSIRRVVVAGWKDDLSLGSWTHLERLCANRGITLEVLAESFRLVAEGSEANNESSPAAVSAADRAAIRARLYWRVKRAIDIALASSLLIAAVPLFLLTFLGVLVDVGYPAIFWQHRVGRDRKSIFVYKFRTLRAPFGRHGEPIPEALRLRSIGRFFRKTRLDELPQLFNVLKGDMSIVGPRPLLIVDQLRLSELRLSVKPGLTGWAQVHGGNLITASEKNSLDEWYIRNASLWLDTTILAKTLMTVVRGDRRAEGILSRSVNEGREQLQMHRRFN